MTELGELGQNVASSGVVADLTAVRVGDAVDPASDPVGEAVEPTAVPFGDAFDWYQRVLYDVEAIAAATVEIVIDLEANRVLDCAAGSGLPALRLREEFGCEDGLRLVAEDGDEMIVDLVCSDGSKTMVDQFRRNAHLLGVDAQCDVVDWADLEADEDAKFDLVLCRGNSLVYATTWDGGDSVSDLGGLQACIESFASVLQRGGHLLVDAPVALEMDVRGKQIITEHKDHDATVEVIENVTETEHSRYWECIVDVTPQVGGRKSVSFDLHSAKFTVDDLDELLRTCGFEIVKRFHFEGDRDCHQTILARHPGQ